MGYWASRLRQFRGKGYGERTGGFQEKRERGSAWNCGLKGGLR